MLREDKNAWIEGVLLWSEAWQSANGEVNRLNGEIREARDALRRAETELARTQLTHPKRPWLPKLWWDAAVEEEQRRRYEREARAVSIARLNEQISAANLKLSELETELVVASENYRQREETARIPGRRLHGKDHYVDFPEDQYEAHAQTQAVTPVFVTTWGGRRWWWYLDRFWWDSEGLSADDVQALVLQRDKKKQAALERARAEVFGAATVEVADTSRSRREPIPESVRHEVWRRDGGACVDCGSRERLEFDHIIPVSQGGSNTARNIELRCETCNRRKGATI